MRNRKKRLKKRKQILRDQWDTVKQSICAESQKDKGKSEEAERPCEQIMAENFPNLVKTHDYKCPQQSTNSQISSKRPTTL